MLWYRFIPLSHAQQLHGIPTVPPGDNPKHDIYILAPFLNIQSGEKIDYAKEFIGDTAPVYYGPDETKYAKEQNIKEKVVLKGIPKDTVIRAPADGLVEFAMRPKIAPSETVEGANLYYKGPDGVMYQLMIFGNPGDFFKPLIDAKPYELGTNQNLADRKKMFVQVKRGDPLMATLQITDLFSNGRAWPSGELGVGSNKNYPVNLNFITLPDGAGQEKLAILAK